MKVYEVWSTDNEKRASCKGVCDSIEAALEFTKTIRDWCEPKSVFDNINATNPKDDWHIREKELITLATLKNNNKYAKVS